MALSGWRDGVIVLTDTRLVYLRDRKGETIVWTIMFSCWPDAPVPAHPVTLGLVARGLTETSSAGAGLRPRPLGGWSAATDSTVR